MPNSRVKSCDNCRVAKARCSLSSPCSRCVKRCLQCHYSHTRDRDSSNRQRRKDLRPILPITTASIAIEKTVNNGRPYTDHLSSTADISEAVLPAVSAAETGNYFPSSDTNSEENAFDAMVTLLDTGTRMPDLTMYHSDTSSPFDVSITSNLSHELPSLPEKQGDSGDSSVYPYFVDPLSTLISLNLPYSTMNFGLSTASSPMLGGIDFKSSDFLMTAANSTDVPCKPYLSMRERSFRQGSLTAKMLLSQLIDFARRIADGRNLPPFIHPPCFLSQNDECPSEAPHNCLPKSLAICKNLSQMFYSRTVGSSAFIWQQIHTHVRQMHAEYKSYDKESLLQALQATIIYGLLCSQCIEFVAGEDAEWLISTTETFARRLYGMCSYELAVDYTSLSRNRWVFVESLRRVGCIMYLIDLLLLTKGQTPSKGKCPEFIDVPLPCTRELWQPISDRDWKKRYNEDNSSKIMKGGRGLTMGNLFLFRQSLSRGENFLKAHRADLAKELAEWVEKVDDLSMLLWMAVTLEGEGQALMIQGTLNMA